VTKAEQIEFITNLAQSFVEDFKWVSPKVPDNWDGNELRAWFSDTVSDRTRHNVIKENPRSARTKQYKTDIVMKDL
jgi:hypothetical protein